MITTYTTHLIFKTLLTADVMLLKFGLDEPAEIVFIPGQYLILFVPQPAGDPARRLFSIASSPREKNSFELLAKIIPGGVASEFFVKLQPDEKVMFQGPAGRFFLQDDLNSKIFLATGTGLAPIRSILHSFVGVGSSDPNHDTPLPYVLFWGLPAFKDVYFLEELKNLAQKNPTFSFTICLSREQSLDAIPEADRKYFSLGRITTPLTSKPWQSGDYYLCGNRDIVESLKTYLTEQGVEKPHLFFEKF